MYGALVFSKEKNNIKWKNILWNWVLLFAKPEKFLSPPRLPPRLPTTFLSFFFFVLPDLSLAVFIRSDDGEDELMTSTSYAVVRVVNIELPSFQRIPGRARKLAQMPFWEFGIKKIPPPPQL